MLIAVYHVLRRLLMPRHPPFAFFRLFAYHAETAPVNRYAIDWSFDFRQNIQVVQSGRSRHILTKH